MGNCIGLFGTCGNSKWRDPFISQYQELGIDFFNPLVDNWKPEDAVEEAKHLAEDNIILFPITNETYAVGSLSEVGFGVLNAIKLDDRRDFVVMIDQKLTDELMKDIDRAKESLRARALVLQHLKAQNLPNVYHVDTLEEMKEVSIAIFESNLVKEKIAKYSIKNKGK
jgi:hypothetical protein